MSIVTIYILYADDVRVLSTDKVRQFIVILIEWGYFIL